MPCYNTVADLAKGPPVYRSRLCKRSGNHDEKPLTLSHFSASLRGATLSNILQIHLTTAKDIGSAAAPGRGDPEGN